MNPRRQRSILLLLLLLIAGLALLAWSQPWLTLPAGGDLPAVQATGGDVAAPILPVALAALAGTAAIPLTPKGIRPLVALAVTVLGTMVIVFAFEPMADPVAAMLTPISNATGFEGDGAVRELLGGHVPQLTLWPRTALLAGGLLFIVGVFTMLSCRRWPDGKRRYERDARTAPASAAADRDTRASQWDALSAGDDPTGDERPDRQVD